MQRDIRKWLMKPHEKGNVNASKKVPEPEAKPETPTRGGGDGSVRTKTSKYFAKDKQKGEERKEDEEEGLPSKRKLQCEVEQAVKPPPAKKAHKVEVEDIDSDEDFVTPDKKRAAAAATPSKRLKSGSGRGVVKKPVKDDESDEDAEKGGEMLSKSGGRGRGVRGAGRGIAKKPVKDEESDEDAEKGGETPSKSGGRGRGGRGAGRGVAKKPVKDDESDEDAEKGGDTPSKSGGRGRGGRGGSAVPAGGRGRGGGRGGFMNFGERKDPPHKGEKEVPEGAPDCLAGLTFVISGTLDSLEREEAEDLIKRHGGRVTTSVSKKTSYLLCDEDVEGRKSSKAKELGTPFLTEDGLFDKIRSSKPAKTPVQEESKSSAKKQLKTSPQKADKMSNLVKNAAPKGSTTGILPGKLGKQSSDRSSMTWTEKYKPKVPNDIIGNQSLVTQLHNWLKHWDEQFSDSGKKGKGKKQDDAGAKKAVLLSGTPGIGKTTSAKLVSQMLGFQTTEVNASDTRGKADSKIFKGMGGSNANSIKESISNAGLSFDLDRSKHPKTVLIMDEVDGMSAGDRGGVADLIDSIKKSKIPIICICNDRYSQKLKSLVNHCLLLNFRKPTKQQMAKRLMQVANAEGLQVNEIALEELAEKVNGDMRMALNQLQYMSLSMSAIKYDDIRQRLLSSAKDEDISPFTAVDKLFGFNGGKLRMDERLDLSMSDPDLVPLLVQENYINYRPSSIGKDENGMKRMSLLARAAESIADGDIINVQIRRYRQWQLSQNASIASCITPAALLHGQREILEPGERNFNRFGGWLGKNSTMGKNVRLLEDLHYHLLASRESNLGRGALRLEYLTLLLKRLTDPLRVLPKDEGVREVVEFMNLYSITQEDVDTIVELSKFQGHKNPLDGIPSAVKAALTRAYKECSKSKMVRAADLVTLPGIKKAPKKRVAAMIEPPVDGAEDENGELPPENEEGNSSDAEDLDGAADEAKLQSELQSLNSNGIQVEMELNTAAKSNAKKKSPAGRGKGGSASAEKKSAGRGRGGPGSSEKAGAKRKR